MGDVRLATPSEAAEAISSAEAVQAAIDDGYDWANGEPFLVVISRTARSASDEPIVERLAWLIRWDDLSIEFPRPQPPDGTLLPAQPYRFAYVIVDAYTAEVLSATYMD